MTVYTCNKLVIITSGFDRGTDVDLHCWALEEISRENERQPTVENYTRCSSSLNVKTSGTSRKSVKIKKRSLKDSFFLERKSFSHLFK